MSSRRPPTLGDVLSVDELNAELQELMAMQEGIEKRKAELEEILSSISDYRLEVIELNLKLRAIQHERGLLSNEMYKAVMRQHGSPAGTACGGGQLPALLFMR